jgi:sarcosine oxidase subunit gamma
VPDPSPGVRISPGPALDRLILRGAAASFPLRLPECVGTVADHGGCACLCLGPDEWLLLAPPGLDDLARLRAFDGPSGVAIDIGHRQVALTVTGPDAAVVLNTGCLLDLHPTVFAPGRCTRTILGRAEIVLWRRAEDSFHLEVARSFTAYVEALLREAALSESPPPGAPPRAASRA